MKALFLSLTLTGVSAVAWSAGKAEDAMPRAQFQFQHQTISVGNQYQDEKFWRDETTSVQNTSILKHSDIFGKVNQYDATISYPFTSTNKSLNFDLGVNLRFIDGEFSQNDVSRQPYHFNTTLPMLYANALYNVPNSGLSASFGARHSEYEHYYAFDYKAKLSYEWQNGFGLEGGWQHQQFSFDGGDIQAEIEHKGPFLDLKYRF